MYCDMYTYQNNIRKYVTRQIYVCCGARIINSPAAFPILLLRKYFAFHCFQIIHSNQVSNGHLSNINSHFIDSSKNEQNKTKQI